MWTVWPFSQLLNSAFAEGSSHRQFMNYWMRLCHIQIFTKPGGGPYLACKPQSVDHIIWTNLFRKEENQVKRYQEINLTKVTENIVSEPKLQPSFLISYFFLLHHCYINEQTRASVYWLLDTYFFTTAWDPSAQKPASTRFKLLHK